MQIRRIAIFGIATRYILSYPVTHLGVETYITHFLDLNTSLVPCPHSPPIRIHVPEVSNIRRRCDCY